MRAREPRRTKADDAGRALARVAAGDMHWIVPRGLEDLPRALAEHRVPAESARGSAIKSGRLRSLRVVDLPALAGGGVLKEYTPRGAAALLRHAFAGSAALREWKILRHLQTAGVNVPEPLAVGVAPGVRARGCGALLLRRVPGAATLEDLLRRNEHPQAARSLLAERLGRLVAGMHAAGVAHPDLHAANVLVAPDGCLFLIDFHSARLREAPLSMRLRERDLLALSGAFLVHGRRTDRLRFLRSYGRDLFAKEEFRHAARRLESAAWARLRVFLDRYDRRPLRPGRAFQRLAVHEWNGMGVATERALVIARGLGPDPEESLNASGTPLKRDGASGVYAAVLGGERCVVKTYAEPGAAGMLKRLLQGPRARRAWFNGHRLLSRQLPAALPILYLAEPWLSPRGRSLVVFEEVPGLPTLDRFVQAAARRELGALSRNLALAVARMHTFFLANRDMKAPNVLVGPQAAPVFIDPDGVRAAGEADVYTMARDLMRLNASFLPKGPVAMTDRLRFLRTYARARRLPEGVVRALRFEIAHLTMLKWTRPLSRPGSRR